MTDIFHYIHFLLTNKLLTHCISVILLVLKFDTESSGWDADYPNPRLKGQEKQSFRGKQIHFVTYPHILYEKFDEKKTALIALLTLTPYLFTIIVVGKMQLLTNIPRYSSSCEVLRTT